MNMKKIINIFSFVSVIAVLLLCLGVPFLLGNDRRNEFISLCYMGVVMIFAIPLLFRSFSLAYNKDKIKPQIWLIIYGIAVLVYVVIAINFGFVDMTRDLPLAIRKEFSQIGGSAQTIKITKSTQTIIVQGVKFSLSRDSFESPAASDSYQFVYLPNSKYVIDIIDDNGISLLKN